MRLDITRKQAKVLLEVLSAAIEEGEEVLKATQGDVMTDTPEAHLKAFNTQAAKVARLQEVQEELKVALKG